MPISKQAFGQLPDGGAVELYTLVNANGLEARVMNLGGTLVGLQVPDRNGQHADVVLGFDSLEGYLQPHPYFGSLVGRYANRIAGGRFSLDGQLRQLACNDGGNHLHGGIAGFDKRLWTSYPSESQDGPRLILTYTSADGEEGYPGKLEVQARYALGNSDELRIDYRATSSARTVVNLTNHAYFNLGGGGSVLEHLLQIAADRFLPVDPTLIPTGELRPVRGTPMDFTRPVAIGAGIGKSYKQLQHAGGYDHCWVLGDGPAALALAALAYDPRSGRELTVHTTQPGLQFYSGNFLDGSLRGKGGVPYAKHAGFCLETEHFPDSPNRPEFPTTVLEPEAVYRHTTVYAFRTRDNRV